MTTIEKILDSKGPLMSSALVELLEKTEKISKNTASQKVSRSKSIKKIKGFYSSNQSFCFLEHHLNDTAFFDNLLESMELYGKKYWYCLNAIRLHGGMISREYLECYTNYPVIALKSHIPFRQVMQNFVKNGILIFEKDHYMISPKFNQLNNNYSYYKTIEMIKDDILNNFHNYTKKIGLISYNTGKKFSEFGKFKWCFKGVCPINSLKTNNKFGFLIADILFGHQIYKKDILYFIEKIKTIQAFSNASKILPFMIVDDLDIDALNLLKKNGIVIGFISELFGQKYAEALKNLVSILNNVGASLKKEPEKYLDLIIQLKKYNEGLANNIKGTLFEFVIGHIHSLDNSSSVTIGRDIIENNAKHEIDVISVYSNKIVFSECKATNSPISFDKIEEWKQIKIQAFKKYALKQDLWKNKKFEFEYWSIKGFDEKAENLLLEMSQNTTKHIISYYSGKDVRAKAIEMKNKKLKEAVDNFFLKTTV